MPKRSFSITFRIKRDLNNLKITNDKFGHLAGDGLIRDMAYILQDAFSEDGYVYRIGGDESAVIYMGSEM